jgi:hypothetical protein
MFFKRTSLVLLIAMLGPVRLVHSQVKYTKWDNGIGHSSWDVGMTSDEMKSMLALWDSIGKEVETEPNPLAGTYFKGGYDAGYFLRWSTNKGFVLIPYFDENLITDYSYGKISFDDPSRIIFAPERDLKGGRSLGKTPREWTAIWNYLVPVESLKDFGEFHAGLGIYNEFNGQCCEFAPNFLSRKIDAKGSQPSHSVPARYAHFIKNPIEGQITFVGRKRRVKNWGYQGKLYGQWMDSAILIPVRVDLGRDRRVKKNMLFRLVGEPGFIQYLQVIRPGIRTSMGYVVRDVSFGAKETYHDSDSDLDKPLPPIRSGIKVTTKPLVY